MATPAGPVRLRRPEGLAGAGVYRTGRTVRRRGQGDIGTRRRSGLPVCPRASPWVFKSGAGAAMSSPVPWPPTVRPWRPEGPKRGDVSFQPPIPSLAAKDFAILNPAILSLAAAGFAVVTTEFVIVGLLPMLAASFAITVPQAGLLVTLFAFTVALFGPLLTV